MFRFKIPHPALFAIAIVLLCGACDGLPYRWRTITIADETIRIRRNPITGISEGWMEYDVPGPNYQMRRARITAQFQCEGAAVLSRITDIEIVSGPPLAPEEEITPDSLESVGWVVVAGSALGDQAEAWMAILKCGD